MGPWTGGRSTRIGWYMYGTDSGSPNIGIRRLGSQCQAQSQVRDSQVSRCVASQGRVLSQPQFASQTNVSSQSTVAPQGHTQTQSPLASQQNDSSQDSVVTLPPLAATIEAGQQTTSSEDQDAKQKKTNQ